MKLLILSICVLGISAAPADMEEIKSNLSAVWNELDYLQKEIANHHHDGHSEQDHDRIVMDVGVMQHEHHIHHHHTEEEMQIVHPNHPLHHSHDALEHLDATHSHDVNKITKDQAQDEHDSHHLHLQAEHDHSELENALQHANEHTHADEHEHSHEHDHEHDHTHEHDHSDGQSYDHEHDHAHEHEHSHGPSHDHEHDHDHEHEHSHGQSHAHAHEHEHSHGPSHDHEHDNDHGHEHSHGQSHDHEHDGEHHHHTHIHVHEHERSHEQASYHEHEHSHDHDDHHHTHDHEHANVHEHDHEHDSHGHIHEHAHDHAHDHDHHAHDHHDHEVHVVVATHEVDPHSDEVAAFNASDHAHHDSHHHAHFSLDDPLHPRNQQEDLTVATCRMFPAVGGDSEVEGNVTILQRRDGKGPMYFDLDLQGFKAAGKRGFHIHTSAPASDGDCSTTGGHFNPHNMTHGSSTANVRHTADLGNVVVGEDLKLSGYVIVDHKTAFSGPDNIISRSLVMHSTADDYGLGGNEASLRSGNAGELVACCAIRMKAVTNFRFGG